jgi:uncharacterized membrane protein
MEEHVDNLNVGNEELPNSSAALVMGILSILCICCGFGLLVGIVLGILSIVYAKKAKTLYDESPSRYTERSANNANAGRICGIVGLCMAGVWILLAITVWILMFLGIIASLGLNF